MYKNSLNPLPLYTYKEDKLIWMCYQYRYFQDCKYSSFFLDDLFTDVNKHVVKDQQEKEEERASKIKPGKTYKVTSLGETDCSFCLKVIEEGNSFVTKKLSSSSSSSSAYLPSVVE